MASEVRVVLADLAENCRAVKIADPGEVPVIVTDRQILTGDPVTREAAWRLFLSVFGGPEEKRS